MPCAILAAVFADVDQTNSALDARRPGSNRALCGVAPAEVRVAMDGGGAAPRARTAGPLAG
jgi:hypothetical protein